MVVFGSYDYNQLVATGPALPIALWPLLSSAYELATNGRMMPVDAFLDRVARLTPPLIDDAEAANAGYRGWLATQPMKALWETGFGNDAARFWVMHNSMASVEPFRGQELSKTGLCLRLPLGAGDAYAEALAAAGVPTRHIQARGHTHLSPTMVDLVVSGAAVRAEMAEALRGFLSD